MTASMTVQDNPLLKEYLELSGGVERHADYITDWPGILSVNLESIRRGTDPYTMQGKLASQYAWAVPNDKAIQACVQHSPLIEMGAGRGYWAMLITQAGGNIKAFDHRVPVNAGLNHYHKESGIFFPVQHGKPKMVSRYPNRTLFLCWPPYHDAMAYQCLKNYTGNKLIYVGESHGCTATDELEEMLERDWEVLEEVEIPQWPGLHDYLRVFERQMK